MTTLTTCFVDRIPEQLTDGMLYVSMEYGTVVHRCACECGGEVITPLTPTDWTLIYNGDGVSLRPSISNSSSGCGAHYFVTDSTVRWCRPLTPVQTAGRQARDRFAKDVYYADATSSETPLVAAPSWARRVLRRLRSIVRRSGA